MGTEGKTIKRTNELLEAEKTPYIHDELVVEILSRLPIRSLLRFRCVCKGWYSLISSPHFVTLQLEQSSKRGERILLSALPYFFIEPIYFVSLEACDDDHHHQVERIYFPGNVFYPARICGSCNGIVFVECNGFKLFLWNPFTREMRGIPSPWKLDKLLGPGNNIYGFGYDSVSDDYKVVMSTDSYGSLEIFVFTLKANRWKLKIETGRYHVVGNKEAVVRNGTLHWVMVGGRDSGILHPHGTRKIVCFDLAEEKLKEMRLPPSFEKLINPLILGVFGGCLCSVVKTCSNATRMIYVWVMKEYGVQESWTNLKNLMYNRCMVLGDPFCFTNNVDTTLVMEFGADKLLLVVNGVPSEMISFYPNNKMRLVNFTYVESLVSLNGTAMETVVQRVQREREREQSNRPYHVWGW